MEVLTAVQSAISEQEGSDPSSIQNREGRGLETYSPIIYWVGWLAVLYFGLYFVTVYVGPAFFGTRPYAPFYYGRNVRSRRAIKENENKMTLAANILSAIDKGDK